MFTRTRSTGLHALTITAMATALFGCGGGGGGGDSTTGTPVATSYTATCAGGTTTTSASSVADAAAQCPVVPIVSSLVTSVPVATYAALSEELAAFNLLNAERGRCGFGLLAQNTQLDTAAKGHADWQLVNNYRGHYQTTGTQLFTGATPEDRITVAGYGDVSTFSAADEISTVLGTSVNLGMGGNQTRVLLNAPYHMKGLLGNFRDIGIAVRNSVDTASTYGPRVVVQFNLAHKASDGPQQFTSGDVQTYPCEGSRDIKPSLNNETPNPVPGRNLATNPLGSSVYIAVREGQTLAITSTGMINVATGASVLLRPAVTSANDPYAPCASGCYKSHEAYIAADAPLDANTKYQVTVSGTNNGTSFSRTFTFTTGG
ncbi:MAG: CAP domain-containing protein [Moraxellaceae bacterium]|nr:CAP domain-containing protein [Moraxellaceae bacterium]